MDGVPTGLEPSSKVLEWVEDELAELEELVLEAAEVLSIDGRSGVE